MIVWGMLLGVINLFISDLTLLSQWFLAPANTLHASTTATDNANSDVSSKEGAVIGAVLADIRHMNKCRINDI
jgi:hypothetical protein